MTSHASKRHMAIKQTLQPWLLNALTISIGSAAFQADWLEVFSSLSGSSLLDYMFMIYGIDPLKMDEPFNFTYNFVMDLSTSSTSTWIPP